MFGLYVIDVTSVTGFHLEHDENGWIHSVIPLIADVLVSGTALRQMVYPTS